jgi:hypothetical protein
MNVTWTFPAVLVRDVGESAKTDVPMTACTLLKFDLTKQQELCQR